MLGPPDREKAVARYFPAESHVSSVSTVLQALQANVLQGNINLS